MEKGTPGLTLGRNIKKLGTRGSVIGEVSFENCRIPLESLLGSEQGTGLKNLQEILDTHFETIGQENLADVKTMVSTGMTLQMGMEMPFKFITKRPDKALLEVDIQGAKMQQAYDGENGWMVAPWTGSAEPIRCLGCDGNTGEQRGHRTRSSLTAIRSYPRLTTCCVSRGFCFYCLKTF